MTDAITFTKMHGAGNDFILIDGFIFPLRHREALAEAWCDRHYGIGSDGLIFIDPSPHSDFYMDFLNPDGSRSFCGNGSRCAWMFAQQQQRAGEVGSFEAIDGMHQASFDAGAVRVSMRPVTEVCQHGAWGFVQTGSPHAILEVEDPGAVDLEALALPVRHDERYAPGGTNVNVVQWDGRSVVMRTFERGVERETLACGTGVTAAALFVADRFGASAPVNVETPGGTLRVGFEQAAGGFVDIWLEGPAEVVFQGMILQP